nr:hypothetical protein [Halobellus rufus]
MRNLIVFGDRRDSEPDVAGDRSGQHHGVLRLDQLSGDARRLGRVELGVAVHERELAVQDAAVGVDLVDPEVEPVDELLGRLGVRTRVGLESADDDVPLTAAVSGGRAVAVATAVSAAVAAAVATAVATAVVHTAGERPGNDRRPRQFQEVPPVSRTPLTGVTRWHTGQS